MNVVGEGELWDEEEEDVTLTSSSFVRSIVSGLDLWCFLDLLGGGFFITIILLLPSPSSPSLFAVGGSDNTDGDD